MDVRHISFRLLQVFREVARTRNISAAARALHLTQPTVSLQLKRLREAVGEPLFDERSGAFTLTDVGTELFVAAGDVLGRFEDFDLFLAQARGGQAGHVRIGLVTTAKYVLPRILGPFYRRFPKIQVTLSIGNRANILDRFARQEDDVYVFSHPPAGPEVLATRIVRNPLQIIAPPDHWAAGRERLDFAELKGERFLIREPGSATRMMFEAWLTGHGLELSDTMQIGSNEAIRLGTASGLGLALLSAHTLQEGSADVAVLNVYQFPLESNWYLVTRREGRTPYAVMQLIDFISGNLAQCVDPAMVAPECDGLAAIYRKAY